jgi:hypothetical protein
MPERYEVIITVWLGWELMRCDGRRRSDLRGLPGLAIQVNEAMVEHTNQHRNWQEFAEPDVLIVVTAPIH